MGYRQLMERCGYTQETAAAKIGKSRSAVANSLRILNLTPRCLELLRDGALSAGHAKALLSLSDPAMQDEAAEFYRAEQAVCAPNGSALPQNEQASAGKAADAPSPALRGRAEFGGVFWAHR